MKRMLAVIAVLSLVGCASAPSSTETVVYTEAPHGAVIFYDMHDGRYYYMHDDRRQYMPRGYVRRAPPPRTSIGIGIGR